MTLRTASLRRLALAAMWAVLGLAPLAHAADASEQRLALACTRAADCATHTQSSVKRPATLSARQAAGAAVAKKTTRSRTPEPTAVDYERDLWRHQSAS